MCTCWVTDFRCGDFRRWTSMSTSQPARTWKKGAVAATNHAWGQVDTLLTVDDNLLPYVTVPVD